jgi:hypothetical protein
MIFVAILTGTTVGLIATFTFIAIMDHLAARRAPPPAGL